MVNEKTKRWYDMKNKEQQQQEKKKLVSDGIRKNKLVEKSLRECLRLVYEHGIKVGRWKQKYQVV